MSRIILHRYPTGQEHIVVGWDHPARGAFWQEFNLVTYDGTGRPCYETDEAWQEVSRSGGMWPGIPLDDLRKSMPEDLRPLLTADVMRLLFIHARDPDSGFLRPIDLTGDPT